MKLFLTTSGCVVEQDLHYYSIGDSWDQLAVREDLEPYLTAELGHATKLAGDGLAMLPPIGTQEVWAAGVTYLRSRAARMEEAKCRNSRCWLAPAERSSVTPSVMT